MQVHDRLIEALWSETDRLILRVGRLSTQLAASYRLYQSEGPSRYHETQDARAAAILYSMAELESLTRFMITEVNKALNLLAVPLVDVRPCLRPLAAHEIFESLKYLNDVSKVWERRGLATTMDSSAGTMALPVVDRPRAQPPMDGKTPKPEHFALIWEVYGLPSVPFTKGSWQTTLRKLSGVRNDLAHGNLPYEEIFQTAGLRLSDVEGYLDDLAQFSLHFTESWEEYLKSSSYLARPTPWD